MQQTITIKNQEVIVNIAQASTKDVEALLLLNAKWQPAVLNGDKAKGFLSGAFDAALFEQLIEQNTIVVAYDNDILAGYMLSINNLEHGVLKIHKDQVAELKANGKLPSNSNIAIGIQTAVELAYHGSGLIVAIRNEFKNLLRNRYQYLFTTIAKDNIRSYNSATIFGWQVVGSDEHYYYLTLLV